MHYPFSHSFSEAQRIQCFFGLPAKIFPYSGSREGNFQKHCCRVPKFDVIICRRHTYSLFWTVVNTMNKQSQLHMLRCVTNTIQFRFNSHNIQTQERLCTYKRNFEARSRNHCCPRKTISVAFSVRVCSLIHSAFKAHVPVDTVLCIFPHYLINDTIIWK